MKIYVLDKYKAVFLVSVIVSAAAFFIYCLTPLANEERLLPIYSVETEEKAVAVTFDSAWTAEDISSIAKTLDSYGCRATFFVVGTWAEKNPDAVRLLSDRGHEIAGHSYDHAHYNNLTESELMADMAKCDAAIKNITGKNVPLFRSPYGEYNNTVVRAANESGRYLIQWDADSLDWKDLSEGEIINRVMKKVKNGSIILLHNGTKNTASALPKLLDKLKSEGYSFKSAGELIYRDNYKINSEGRQIKLK